MSRSQGFKGGTTDEVFQEQSFLCEREAPCMDFRLFKLSELTHKNLYNTLKKKLKYKLKKKKRVREKLLQIFY